MDGISLAPAEADVLPASLLSNIEFLLSQALGGKAPVNSLLSAPSVPLRGWVWACLRTRGHLLGRHLLRRHLQKANEMRMKCAVHTLQEQG